MPNEDLGLYLSSGHKIDFCDPETADEVKELVVGEHQKKLIKPREYVMFTYTLTLLGICGLGEVGLAQVIDV